MANILLFMTNIWPTYGDPNLYTASQYLAPQGPGIVESRGDGMAQQGPGIVESREDGDSRGAYERIWGAKPLIFDP